MLFVPLGYHQCCIIYGCRTTGLSFRLGKRILILMNHARIDFDAKGYHRNYD